jgi:hypothetical protein
LGHPQLSPDGAHIVHLDMNSDPAGLTLGMFAGLGQAFDQFLAQFVHAVLVNADKLLSGAPQAPVYRSPRIRREVIALCLRVDHHQVKRHCRIMIGNK